MVDESVIAGAAVFLTSVVLLAVSTWSKRRLMARLLPVVKDGEAMTSWLASTSGIRGVAGEREVWIENVSTIRGVLKISVEHRSSARAEAHRRTWLRTALEKVVQRDSERGHGLYFRRGSSEKLGSTEEAKDQIVRFMSEHPSLDRLIVLERWIVVFRIGYRKLDLHPETMRQLLCDLCDIAQSLE